MSAETPPPSPPPPAAAGSVKAWASGRTLNENQRERKRQMDRVSKSKRRKDDQQLVQNLKAKVDELTAKVKALETQSADQATVAPTSTTVATSLPTRSLPPNIYDPNQVAHYPEPGFVEEINDAFDPLVSSSTVSVPPLPHETSLVALPGPGVAQQTQTVSIQDLFNHLLGMALVVDRTTICIDDALSSNAIIRGILHGWDGVLSAPYLCPLWEVLSRFDSLIFGFTSVLTRFSTLKTIHTFMLFLSGTITTQQLPPWHRPRPTQARFPHDLAVDVLPWPLLRERAVLHPEITKDNKFWREIIGLFQLHWPYAPEAAFQINSATGLFNFSGLYENHVRDLRMWRMQTDFFKSFPSIFEDIMLITPINTHPVGVPVRRAIKAGPPPGVVQEDEELQNPSHQRQIYHQPTWNFPNGYANFFPPSG